MTPISKNVYIDKLHGIVNKYNTYHKANKMKPVDANPCMYVALNKENNQKILNLKLVIRTTLSNRLHSKLVRSLCDQKC